MRNLLTFFLIALLVCQSLEYEAEAEEKEELSPYDFEEINTNKDKMNDIGNSPEMKTDDIDMEPELRIIEIFHKYPEDKDKDASVEKIKKVINVRGKRGN